MTDDLPGMPPCFVKLPDVRVDGTTYTAEDQFRDFIHVFHGENQATAQQKERVLSQLLARTGIWKAGPVDVERTHTAAFMAGERNIGLWLTAVLTGHEVARRNRRQALDNSE